MAHKTTGPGSSTVKDYRVLIKGGLIYDGTLNSPYKADIRINGERIEAIGNLNGKADVVIDAAGKIVTPGFIDCHNHSDFAWKTWHRLTPSTDFLTAWKGNYNNIYQGVTTIITGHCGMGYTKMSEWFSTIESIGGFGTNIYHLIPYDALKSEIIGTDLRPATSAEYELIKKRVTEEIRQGALGFSTGLDMPPAVYDTLNELIDIAKVINKYGGIYDTHIRSESAEQTADGKIRIVEAVKEAIDIGRMSGISVQISHIKVDRVLMNPQVIIDLIEDARKHGINVTADQYPYDAGTQRIQFLLDTKYRTGEKVRDEFRSSDGRAVLKKGVEAVLSQVRPESIKIVSCDTKIEYQGKSLTQIAEAEARSPEDIFVELACQEIPPFCVFFTQDMNIVRQFMKCDWVFTGSDAVNLPRDVVKLVGKFHPRFYGTFSKKIRQFALDERVIDLLFAIRSMTSLPADKFGLKNRGRISEGYYADIAVIDQNKLTDKSTYENTTEYSEGVTDLIVNGTIEIRNSKTTGKWGGRPCKKERGSEVANS